MSASPPYKVYDSEGKYQASTWYVEVAAALVGTGLLGDHPTIRYGHAKKDIVWAESIDGQACDSYDAVASHVATVLARRRAARQVPV
jgi:hypothetical protein